MVLLQSEQEPGDVSQGNLSTLLLRNKRQEDGYVWWGRWDCVDCFFCGLVLSGRRDDVKIHDPPVQHNCDSRYYPRLKKHLKFALKHTVTSHFFPGTKYFYLVTQWTQRPKNLEWLIINHTPHTDKKDEETRQKSLFFLGHSAPAMATASGISKWIRNPTSDWTTVSSKAFTSHSCEDRHDHLYSPWSW